jgi:ATP-dependent RNA helicase DHX29
VEFFVDASPRDCTTPRKQPEFRMAGGKKKKKPASNPARAVATTSIASKTKELPEPEVELAPLNEANNTKETQRTEQIAPATSTVVPNEKTLTAEEFEKQLEESELQVLVEKHAQKSKRDAARQKSRLETDRRVLRGQATEEELTIRLWTLQQALLGSGFIAEKVNLALRQVLDISDKIGMGNKDTIWGLEEALDWLARNCSREELPDYENSLRKTAGLPRSQSGWLLQNAACIMSLLEYQKPPSTAPYHQGQLRPVSNPTQGI